MADTLDSSSSAPQIPDPTSFVPVTAADVERRRLKLWLGITAVALIVGLAVWFIYRRTTDPVLARQAFDAGARLIKNNRYEQAILNFDRAIELQSDFSDAYLLRARAKVATYRSDTAIPDFNFVIAARPSDAGPLTERAFTYLDLKQWDKTIEDTSKAIALNPKLARAYNARGTAYRMKGDLSSSLADFGQAVRFDPSLDNYFQRASTYQLLSRHKEAIADFDEAIVIAPDQPHLFFARAKSKMAIGDGASAKQDIQIGRRMDGW
ncbi:MAG: tetratricopeptide repeat protein [Bryobacteraceae bacterium]